MNKQTLLFENKSLLGTVLQHKRKMYGCNDTLRELSAFSIVQLPTTNICK